MKILISPAKALDFAKPAPWEMASQAAYLDQSQKLVSLLKKKTPAQLGKLMQISDALAVLNHQRFQDWQRPILPGAGKQAIFAFNGDVYQGLEASSLELGQVEYLQQHLGILSGLYGLLKPLDLILPYRLEMGSKLTNPKGKDLYAFWGSRLTQDLNQEFKGQASPVLVNLASQEYSKVIQPKQLKARFLQVDFKEEKEGQFKTLGFFAKRARGLMVRYAALHRITQVEDLKSFALGGYAYHPGLSQPDHWAFTRKEPKP